jgi:hypothetical protein
MSIIITAVSLSCSLASVMRRSASLNIVRFGKSVSGS